MKPAGKGGVAFELTDDHCIPKNYVKCCSGGWIAAQGELSEKTQIKADELKEMIAAQEKELEW